MLTTVAAGRVFDYSYSIGLSATEGKGFASPQDFVLGPNGRMYIVNRGIEALGLRMLRISTVNLDHQLLGEFAGSGSGDGQFIWPRSIELDQDERVYISDEYLHRISIFDDEGDFLSSWGQAGSGDGELNGPSGLAFDSDDNLYVVDSLNHRVQKFTKEASSSASGDSTATAMASSTCPGASASTVRTMCTSPTGETTGSRSSPPMGSCC